MLRSIFLRRCQEDGGHSDVRESSEGVSTVWLVLQELDEKVRRRLGGESWERVAQTVLGLEEGIKRSDLKKENNFVRMDLLILGS
jgi:hypothetical protein